MHKGCTWLTLGEKSDLWRMHIFLNGCRRMHFILEGCASFCFHSASDAVVRRLSWKNLFRSFSLILLKILQNIPDIFLNSLFYYFFVPFFSLFFFLQEINIDILTFLNHFSTFLTWSSPFQTKKRLNKQMLLCFILHSLCHFPIL